MELTFFGVFLIIGFIGSIILFYLEGSRKDSEGKKTGDWVYQLLYFLYAIFSFSILVYYSFFMISHDFNLGLDHDKIVLDKVDLSNLVFSGSEAMTSSTDFFVYNFNNIDSDKENTLKNSDFCFYYNNSDSEANVLAVTNGVTRISDYYYVDGLEEDYVCLHINSSFVKKNALIGLVCLDCSVPNPIELPQVNISSPIKEIHIVQGNPLNYTIDSENVTHIFWLQTNNSIGWIVKEWYFKLYLLAISAFLMAFGFRWGYKYVSEDYDDIFTKM